MILLNFHSLITAYFSALMIGIFYAWIVHVIQKRHRIRWAPLTKGTTCEYCHYRFIIDNDKKTYCCPQCGLFNRSLSESESKKDF